MNTIFLKKEKWYHSNYSIYSDSSLIGQFIPEKWKSVNWITINSRSYMIKRGSFWKDDKLIYSDNILLGTISNHPFKNFFIVSIIGKNDYTIKINFWKSKYSIFVNGELAGEYISKWRGSWLYSEKHIEESAIAAIIVQVNSIKRTAQRSAAV